MNAERQPQVDSPEAEESSNGAPQPSESRAEWEKQYDQVKKVEQSEPSEESWQNQYAQVRDVEEAPGAWAAKQEALRVAHESGKLEMTEEEREAEAKRVARIANEDLAKVMPRTAPQQPVAKKWWQIWK